MKKEGGRERERREYDLSVTLTSIDIISPIFKDKDLTICLKPRKL